MNEITDNTVPSDPISLFHQWLEQARLTEINDPETFCLATSGEDGQPSARMLLLKEADGRGFKFHTNEQSQKGRELALNPKAAMCFHWKSLRKQVRVEGRIEQAGEEEADAYFKTRSRASQLGAVASAQSRPLKDRATFEAALAKAEKEYEGKDVPRPPYWRGYRLVPARIEFWLDQPNRLHDRFVYTREDDGWAVQRLYP